MSGATRRRALAQRHKGGRHAGSGLKIASTGSVAAGAASVRYALLYSVLNDRDKRINGMFLHFRCPYECMTLNSATACGHSNKGDIDL